jgi:hypothetical protein
VIKTGPIFRSLWRLSVKTREREGRQIKLWRDPLGKLCSDFAQHGGKLKPVAAQPGDEQRVVMARQGVDDKVFIRRVVVGAGCTVEQAANARQNIAQERKGFRTILG